MAERDTLLSTLPPEVRDDAERLYGQTRDPDPHDIVAELHRRGLLRDDQLRDAVLALEGALHVGRMRSKPPAEKMPTILGPLGEGAMGEVLLAKDEGLNRVVAFKRLKPELASRPAILERFYKEAQITAQLDHPSIVPIHGLIEPGDGSLAYTMKLVRGRTLHEYLDEARVQWRSRGGEAGEHVLSARLERFLQVCEAVGYAHDRGVVHRDLKPENVMIGAFGQVQVMDWGIAKVLDQPENAVIDEQGGPTRKSHGTRVGSVFGTPRYMSPEQAEGRNDILDGQSDQYALGLILFELVTLQPAIDEKLDVEQCLVWAKAARKRPMTHLHRKGPVARELVAIVNKATQQDPARRYPSVPRLAEDVRRYLRDEAVTARPDGLVQRIHRWVGRHRSAVVMLLLGTMLLAVLVVGLTMFGGLGVLEWRRRGAETREQALTGLVGLAMTGGSTVDGRLRAAESGLVGLTYAAEAALERPKEETIVLDDDPFSGMPARLQKSSVYGRQVSVDRPSFAATGRSEQVDRDVERLSATSYAMGRVVVDSSGGESKLARRQRYDRVANTGVPIRWARIGTESGVIAVMPGATAFRSGVVPSREPWYRSDDQPTIVWSVPHVDPDGTGLVLTANRPLYGRTQDKLGVAAIDLTLDDLSDALVLADGVEDVFVTDANGRVVVWRDMKAADATAFTPPPLPDKRLVVSLATRPEGWVELGDHIAVWAPVAATGWRYLLWLDADQLHTFSGR